MSEPGQLSIKLGDFSDEDDLRERIAWTANLARWFGEAEGFSYNTEVDWAHDHVWLRVKGIEASHVAALILCTMLGNEGRGHHRKGILPRLSFGVTWTPPIKKERKKC